MRHKNFLIRTVNLLAILAVLAMYQQTAAVRAAAVDQRQQEIAEVEAYNASILQAEQEKAEQEAEGGLRDGTYEGSGLGFGDTITVSVTIQDGRMTDISVVSAPGEDRPYYKQALTMLDKMLSAQSPEVDLVSGATLTCEGIQEAVADALGKAAV